MPRGKKLKRSVRAREAVERKWRAGLAKLRRNKAPRGIVRWGRSQTMVAHKRTVAARKRLENFRHRVHRPLRLRALDQARATVGVMERGGNNTGPVVDKIIRANGGAIGEPWCGDAVAFWYRLAGSKVVQRGWASTLQLGFLLGMGRTSRPKPGDIVVYDFPGGQSSDHTGLFVRDLGSEIEAIEGNTGSSGAVSDSATGGDGVYVKHRSKSLVARYVRVHR